MYKTGFIFITALVILLPTNSEAQGLLGIFKEAVEVVDTVTKSDSNDTRTASSLSSCNNGLASKALGAAVIGNDSDLTKFAAGAWATCLVAGELQTLLGAEDQQNVATSTEATIATGSESKWENSATGTKGSTKVYKTTSKTTNEEIVVLKDKVETVPPVEYIGSEYVALSAANLRGGPGEEYKVYDIIVKDKKVYVAAKVIGAPWLMVSSGGVGQGFVRESFFSPTGKIGEIGETPAGDVETAKVEVKQNCRFIEQSVTLEDGTTKVEKIEACQGPNGWEIA